MKIQTTSEPKIPTLAELGIDLLHITGFQRVLTLLQPFLCVAAYVVFASYHFWPLAVMTLMYLSFMTYGSISHDLVHRTLGLPAVLNEIFLTLIELLAFRSGHAYRLAHLNHHARYPHDDDIEGAAAKMSFLRALAEGVVFLPRITLWALKRPHRNRFLVVAEVLMAGASFILCFALLRFTSIFAVYAMLMIMGSWIFPLVTSYIPHNPTGQSTLSQTRLFRGTIVSIVAMEHLYHLEHHLYPAVPHHNWPKLAERLNPHFAAADVHPIILVF